MSTCQPVNDLFFFSFFFFFFVTVAALSCSGPPAWVMGDVFPGGLEANFVRVIWQQMLQAVHAMHDQRVREETGATAVHVMCCGIVMYHVWQYHVMSYRAIRSCHIMSYRAIRSCHIMSHPGKDSPAVAGNTRSRYNTNPTQPNWFAFFFYLRLGRSVGTSGNFEEVLFRYLQRILAGVGFL